MGTFTSIATSGGVRKKVKGKAIGTTPVKPVSATPTSGFKTPTGSWEQQRAQLRANNAARAGLKK